MHAPPTAYLVDDQAMVRASLRSWLEANGTYEVVGQQAAARPAIDEIRRLLPDLVLHDISMPGLSGLEALPLILKAHPAALVVMVSDFESSSFVREALAGGARGYLSKADDPEEIVDGLARVIGGERYVSPRIGYLPDIP